MRRPRTDPNLGWSTELRSDRRPSALLPPRCIGQWPWGRRNNRNSRHARRSSLLCPVLLCSTPVHPIETFRENAVPTSGPARCSTTFPTRNRLPSSTCGSDMINVNIRSTPVKIFDRSFVSNDEMLLLFETIPWLFFNTYRYNILLFGSCYIDSIPRQCYNIYRSFLIYISTYFLRCVYRRKYVPIYFCSDIFSEIDFFFEL